MRFHFFRLWALIIAAFDEAMSAQENGENAGKAICWQMVERERTRAVAKTIVNKLKKNTKERIGLLMGTVLFYSWSYSF